MATTLNTLYPPQVDTFMPSFCYNSSAKVWFNISSYNDDKLDLIKFIHISMVDQRNNKNVYAGLKGITTVYPQYYPIQFNPAKINNNDSNQKMGYDPDKKMYWVVIPPQVLKTKPYYSPGQYYKVQLRFDLTGSPGFAAYSNNYSNPTSFFYWNNSTSHFADALQLASYSNYNENNFSEWSTGTLLKPILIPELATQNFDTSIVTSINPSTDILISGKVSFKKASGDTTYREENERLSWYRIQILKNTTIYYDSGQIYSSNNEYYYRIDTSMLTAINNNYQLQLFYETNNGYNGNINYPIAIIDYDDNYITDETYTITIDENYGAIIINISELNHAAGDLIIRRSSHRSNFTHWDLIAAYQLTNNIHQKQIIDNTIESMTGYRYQIQNINENILYKPQYTDILHCDFYGGLFMDNNNKILSTTFNFQPSNRANAVNRSKTDTLGGQYPLFTQNSKLKYHTYSIQGRISTEDNGESFLSKQDIFGTEYYDYRYNSLTAPHTSECAISSHDDWLYEREYRDAVEEWDRKSVV